MNSANVLIIDDDQDVVLTLSRALKSAGVEAKIHGTTQIPAALESAKKYTPEAIILDLCLDQDRGVESGFSLLKQLLNEDSSCRIIILTGHGGFEHGIKALQLGASNFLEKPAEIPHLKALIKDAITQAQLKRLYQTMLKNQSDKEAHNLITGTSKEMQKVIDAVQYAAHTSQPVLLIGETGTGKGVCAAAIHKLSKRKEYNFVRFQPHFGSADMVHSDLFGHIAGSFTGAGRDRLGLLVEASKGTFFLDEVDEVPLETQIALLGVLQDKKFRPIGSDKTHEIDLRLITATNQDIQKCITNGKVRSDFYHRIAHFIIEIPPLRKRKSDIPLLVDTILQKMRDTEHLNVFSIADKAIDCLSAYNWPGNVRELEAVIEGAAYRAQYEARSAITLDDICIKTDLAITADSDQSFHSRIRKFKIKLIEEALLKCNGNQVQAAKALKIDRATLRRTLADT